MFLRSFDLKLEFAPRINKKNKKKLEFFG